MTMSTDYVFPLIKSVKTMYVILSFDSESSQWEQTEVYNKDKILKQVQDELTALNYNS